MKNYLGKVLCMLLCIALVFSIAACSSDEKQKTTLDLGDDDSWDIDEGGNGTDTGNTDVETGTGDKEKANQNAQDAVADADSLSWSELVAKMPAKLRGSTFTMFSWNPVTDVTDADKVVKNFETQTGIKVVWNQAAYEEYDTKLTALINAKKSPDLIRYITPAPARMYLCQDLKSATGYDFKGDIWDSRVMESYSYNGKYYAANLKNTFNQQPTAIIYRPSQINRYKFEDPYTLWKQGKWTYDKFKEICRAFKDETTRCGWMTSRTVDYLWLNNLDLITFDGKKYKNNLADKNVILGLQEVIANRDDVSPDAASMSDRFADGTYLFESTNILCCRRTDFHYTELKANNDLEAVPFPTQPGKTYYVNFQEFEAFGVPQGAKNGPAAYYFMRCYLNADNYNANTFFCSTQVLETYKYLMNQKNYNFNVERQITGAIGDGYLGVDSMIRKGEMTAAQVKTKLDSVSPKYDQAIQLANETLEKIKKRDQ